MFYLFIYDLKDLIYWCFCYVEEQAIWFLLKIFDWQLINDKEILTYDQLPTCLEKPILLSIS